MSHLPGVRHMQEKAAAWRQKQRDDGVREEDLKPLPELEGAPRQQWATPTNQQPAAPPLPPKPHPAAAQAGAAGFTEVDSLSEEFLNLPGIKHLLEKEAAYTAKQRRDGVKDQDLQPLQELEVKKQQYRTKRQEKQHPVLDKSKFPKVDITQSIVDVGDVSIREAKRMEDLANHGRALLDSLKVCV